MHVLAGLRESVAGIDVIPLCDAVGPMGESIRLPMEETFPGTAPETWRRLQAEVPGSFGPDGEWVLHFHCFMLRLPGGGIALVDTGIGDLDSPAASWAPVPGRLVEALGEASVAPGDIGTVVITHLHSDHAGGAVRHGRPVFPNARYVLQQREVDWLAGTPDHPVTAQVLRPLQDAGCLDTVDGTHRLAPAAELVLTPGHTPGHQSVVLDGHRLVVGGDVFLHKAQVDDPSLPYVYDEDPETAARTRTDLLSRIRASNGLLAAPHLEAPFVRP